MQIAVLWRFRSHNHAAYVLQTAKHALTSGAARTVQLSIDLDHIDVRIPPRIGHGKPRFPEQPRQLALLLEVFS
jgi:hypothetical protein